MRLLRCSPLLLALAASIFGQTTAPAQNLDAIVSYLLPGATITSISPAQSTAILSDASAFVASYTAAHPLSSLQADLIGDLLFATTTPSAAQITSLSALLDGAATGIVADPAAFVSSVNALVAPFPFATDILAYESALLNGLRTVVASDLSVTVPTAASASSAGQTATSLGSGAGTLRTSGGAVVGALVVVAGVVGLGLL